MHDWTRPLLAFALLVPACGPGSDSTATDASTSADTGAETSTASAGTTTDNPTGGSSATSDTAATGDTTDDVVSCSEEGPTVPPAGSPCAVEGELCDYHVDECAFTIAICTGGQWVHEDIDKCGDPCDPFPQEGQQCFDDGAFCDTGCEDQCQFCNILMCSDGTWHHLEAPPAPCLDCAELCPFTVMPMCANGPPDEAACVAGCQDVMAGPCNVEFSATRACAGFEPTFGCDAMERPTVMGCEAAFDDLYACLGI